MQVKPEYRTREETEVAVLDALAERAEDGMTVFEIRSRVSVDIDRLETALADLKADDLIEATEEDDGRTVIVPDEDVIGPESDEQSPSLFERVRDQFGV
ncbi:MarR family transcriptional regulator [Halorhabdus sp. CBA1104]|uniref:DUF6432 family protein n=1 Tax=unclassified Halorhabdus TaxID=2621901 RepID=UPI0012B27531|nr:MULTISPECIES: DUF6432 family protein [unclassified Halorhabdus]QGN07793.1 MarR family transcriptional regulator [Halorhabdus sp. CBA1104]